MALIEQGRLHDAFIDTFGGMELITLNNALELIGEAIAIEAVTVVRCAECIYSKNDTEFCRQNGLLYCDAIEDPTCRYPHDFCSYGEERTK